MRGAMWKDAGSGMKVAADFACLLPNRDWHLRNQEPEPFCSCKAAVFLYIGG
jgi:hypothetical protein